MRLNACRRIGTFGPGQRVMVIRGAEICEGELLIADTDEATATIIFDTPLPEGIRKGDLLILID